MQRAPYHRAYRHLSLPQEAIGWTLLTGVVLSALVLAFGSVLLRAHAQWVLGLLAWTGIPFVRRSVTMGKITFDVADVPSFGATHSTYVAIVAIAGAIVTLYVFGQPRKFAPGRILLGIFCAVSAVSGAYFYFAGDRFPYSTGRFAEVWTHAEFILWVLIPLLFGVALAPLPFNVGRTILYAGTALVYAVWFSVVRLALLLALFHLAGLVWMAPAYFLVGFLVDFIYIVAIYARAIAKAADMLRVNRGAWRW